MTTEQEHLITLLFVKYGGFQEVVDMWLYSDVILSTYEHEAIDAWLADEQKPKPYNIKRVDDPEYPFLIAEITLDTPEKD